MTKLELIDQREEIQAQIDAIIALAETEERELTEDELTQLDELNTKLEEVNVLIDEKDEALRKLAKRNKANFNVGKKEQRSNLITMINDVLNNRQSDALLEVNERGNRLFKGSNLGATGQIILPMEYRAPIAATTITGMPAIPEDKFPLVEALRNRSILFKAGSQFYENLTGDVSIPILGASNVSWAAETAASTDGAAAISEKIFRPLRLTAYVDISKQFLLQAQSTCEGMIINDLGRAVIQKLESTLLGDAMGATTYPAGIKMAAASSVEITPTWLEIIGLEEQLYAANISGDITYLLHPEMSAILQGTSKDAGSGQFIYQNGNINGRNVYSSGNVFVGGLAMGDFSDYAICNWGGAFDITIDPYSQAANGCVRLVVNSYWNGGPRRSSSFIAATIAEE
jgi:HK97 family phage major capsid protein